MMKERLRRLQEEHEVQAEVVRKLDEQVVWYESEERANESKEERQEMRP